MMVKKIKSYLVYTCCFSIAFFLLSCELDNFEGPDAQVFGALIDAKTGEPVQQEIGTSGDAAKIQVIEYGYSSKNPQEWLIKTNGEYRNNLVFSGTYDVVINRGNFVKLDTIKGYKFLPGANELSFMVTPNIRVIEPSVTKEENNIVARFKLEYGHDAGKVDEIALFAQEDSHPSNTFNLTRTTRNVSDRELTYENNAAFKNEVFEVAIDLNSDQGRALVAGKKYFFRVGAKPVGLEGEQIRYNYSKVFELEWSEN